MVASAIEAPDGPGAGYEDAAPNRMQRQVASARAATISSSTKLAASATVMGDRWSAALVAVTFRRCSRFDQYLAYLKISPHILSTRLSELIELGMLTRKSYQTSPNRFDYRLTPMGEDFYSVIVSLGMWGDRWLDDGSGPPIILKHSTCKNLLTPTLIRSSCEQELTFSDAQSAGSLVVSVA